MKKGDKRRIILIDHHGFNHQIPPAPLIKGGAVRREDPRVHGFLSKWRMFISDPIIVLTGYNKNFTIYKRWKMEKIKYKFFVFFFFCIFCITQSSILAKKGEFVFQNVVQKGNLYNLHRLFIDDEVLELEIQGPMSAIRRDRGKKKKYHPAKLEYFDKYLKKKVSLKIEVRTRGHFRKNPRNCAFPPLKIKFSKLELKGTLFEKQSSLKLVVHCKPQNKLYEQYLFAEYLVYKLYNLFTSRSLAVRLARISYVEEGKKTITRYAFFIENIKKMARRNGLKHVEYKKGNNYILNLIQRSRLAVFQFMVGNTDWAKFSDHNILFFKPATQRAHISVPYDFDFCGIVNAHYAGPAPESGIKSFQDRVFQGYCRSKGEFQLIFNRFRARRAKIVSLYQDFPLLSPELKNFLTLSTIPGWQISISIKGAGKYDRSPP